MENCPDDFIFLQNSTFSFSKNNYTEGDIQIKPGVLAIMQWEIKCSKNMFTDITNTMLRRFNAHRTLKLYF